MDKTKTDSGKQGGGGCSKESMKTMVDYAQKYEAKIGKEVQTEVRGKPNYQPGSSSEGSSGSGNQGGPENRQSPPAEKNFIARIIDFIMGLFGRSQTQTQSQSNMPSRPIRNERDITNPNEIRSEKGPGGCQSQAECDKYCDQPEHRDECNKFTPPAGGPNRQ